MTTTLTTRITAFTVVGLLSAGAASAAPLHHVDDVARTLERHATDGLRAVRSVSRGLPHAARLEHDFREIRDLARHLHDVVHQMNPHSSRFRRHVRREAAELTRLVHHAETVLDEIRDDLFLDRHISHTSRYGHGRRHQVAIRWNFGHGSSIVLGGHRGHYDSSHRGSSPQHRALRILESRLASIDRAVHHLGDDRWHD